MLSILARISFELLHLLPFISYDFRSSQVDTSQFSNVLGRSSLRDAHPIRTDRARAMSPPMVMLGLYACGDHLHAKRSEVYHRKEEWGLGCYAAYMG